MDMLASIDRQIAELQKMREHIEAAQKAKFDAQQLALPIGGTHKPVTHTPARTITHSGKSAPLPVADDGWIEWGGGECPVDHGTQVKVRCRDRYEYNGSAESFEWSRLGDLILPGDIIAYHIAGERT